MVVLILSISVRVCRIDQRRRPVDHTLHDDEQQRNGQRIDQVHASRPDPTRVQSAVRAAHVWRHAETARVSAAAGDTAAE